MCAKEIVMQIFICGSHTDVGKTSVSAALCYAYGFEYFKLIQAGIPTDSQKIQELSPKTFKQESQQIAKRFKNLAQKPKSTLKEFCSKLQQAHILVCKEKISNTMA